MTTVHPKERHTSKLYVVDDDENMSLNEWLSCYSYMLNPVKDPGCWKWLAGRWSTDQLYYAASVIYARYGMEFTPPAPQLVERKPTQKRATAKQPRRQRRQQPTAKAA